MSSVFPNHFLNNNTGNQLVNVSMVLQKPCPTVAPMIITYYSPIGWNAVVYIYIVLKYYHLFILSF